MQLIDNAVTEYYSPGFVTESIAEARRKGVFVSRPVLKSTMIRWERSEYPIHDAWIEQATRIKSDWIFFRRVIPTGYRLMLVIGTTGKPPGKEFLYPGGEAEAVICNNSIWVTTIQPATPTIFEQLMYAKFSSPVPDSIQCVVKKLN